MAQSASRFARLVEIAGEASSERRRELLREVTDLFFDSRPTRSGAEAELFGDILSRVSMDMEEAVRAELAHRFADAPDAPRRLAIAFAHDVYSVAQPILERSPVLTDTDLLEVIEAKGQDHMRAVARRPEVSETVSTALVTKGDDETLATLLCNEGAQISESSLEAAFDRARANPALHRPMVDRRSLPPAMLNEMYLIVERKLRQQVLSRLQNIDPKDLEAALEASRLKMAKQDGALPADYEAAEAELRALRTAGRIGPAQLVTLLRDRRRTTFLIAFAEAVGVDFRTVQGIFERRDLDAIAVACRASGFDRALYVTIAVLTGGGEHVIGRAKDLGDVYNDVPLEAAQRALRFWRLRRQTDERAA